MKQTADLKKNNVPSGDSSGDSSSDSLFVTDLLDNYRDIQQGKEAFVYFVTRILSSVNAEVTNYRNRKSKELLSKCFTVTDEAFALLILLNGEQVWRNQHGENDKKNWTGPNFQYVYTKNRSGKKSNKWSEEGIGKFWEMCRLVKEKRQNRETGEAFEKEIKEYFEMEDVKKNNREGIEETENSNRDDNVNRHFRRPAKYQEFEEDGWLAFIQKD